MLSAWPRWSLSSGLLARSFLALALLGSTLGSALAPNPGQAAPIVPEWSRPGVGSQSTPLPPPERAVDWSQAGVQGGIPDVPQVADVRDFGAAGDGARDDAPAIQAAIEAAASPGAVFLPAGTYLIRSPLRLREGIVLRGAGSLKTSLRCDLGGRSEHCIEILTYQRGEFTPLLAGLQKGSLRITVQDASRFSPGMTIEIQQDNDPEIMYTKPEWDQSWAQEAVGQFSRVVAVNANTLSISPPLHITYRLELNPVVRPNGLLERAGVEDLYIIRLDSGDGHTILIKNAANCWVRRVESEYTVRSHINVASSMNIEIRESYFHHSHHYGGGGHGYGVDLNRHTTASLVENNIFEHLRHAMMAHVGANANVFAYNYSIDPYQSEGTWTPPDISVHGHYPFMNLFEGNIVQEVAVTDYWGPAGPGNTLLRNRVESENIELKDASHGQNVLGNDLAHAGSQIYVQDGVLDTLLHGNQVNGALQWDPSIPERTIPASLYLHGPPPFFNGLPWPPFGPKTLDGATLPAKERFERGAPVPQPKEPIFADVPPDHPYRGPIEALYLAGFTAGCQAEPLLFCPDSRLDRAQSAVFFVRGQRGADFDPPAVQTPHFTDLPKEAWYTRWVEQLWRDGLTAGCALDPPAYCPLRQMTRAEVSVFTLRIRFGSQYSPPPATGLFGDVDPKAWYAPWVEAAFQNGLMEGCGADAFCPLDLVPRGPAALYLARALQLAW